MADDGAPALQRRRERLLMRSAELRLRLRQHAAGLAEPLAWADRAIEAAQWLRRNPQWPLGGLALWLVLRPRRALRWLGRSWWAWRAARWLLRRLPAAEGHAAR